MQRLELNRIDFQEIVENAFKELELVTEYKKKEILYSARKKYILDEGLIYTETPSKTINFLKANTPISTYHTPIFIVPNNGTNYIKIIFSSEKMTETILKDIEQIMNVCGWFLSSIILENKTFASKDINVFWEEYKSKDKSICALCYDARFDVEAFNLPRYLYYITYSRRVPKIENMWLVPKSKSDISTYPNRIYFGIDDEDIIAFGKSKLTDEEDLALITIDTEELKTDVKFYNDVNSDFQAIYTHENIPKEAIVDIKVIKR